MPDFGQKHKNFSMESYKKNPEILQIVELFVYPEEKKGKLIENLAEICHRKYLIKADGRTFVHHREKAIENLMEVAPLMREEEIDLLYDSPDEFYDKFLFCDSRKFTSLYFALKSMKMDHRDSVFLYAYEEYGITPFEKVKRGLVESILPDLETVWV